MYVRRVFRWKLKYVRPQFMQSVSIQTDNAQAQYSGVHLTHHYSHG